MFEKSPNTKFHENPFSGSRVVPCEGRTKGGREGGTEDGQTDRRTDMKKLTVTFRNFANDPRNKVLFLPSSFTQISL